MSLVLELPNFGNSLRQGEILRDVWEHRTLHAPVETAEGAEHEIDSRLHPFVVAMTPDCDLHHDFAARFPDRYDFPNDEMRNKFLDKPEQYELTHVLVCDALQEGEFRGDLAGSDIWRRVKHNQDERYHRLGPAPVGNDHGATTLELLLDFKKVFAIPLDVLYGGIVDDEHRRLAVIPADYLQDLIHRFYCFQSRVGLPD